MEAAATIPSPHEDDDEDVHWALSTASALWARGERSEALKWLRRAAETASDANADTRALELFKAAAEVATRIGTIPPAGATSQAAPKTTVSPGGSQPPMSGGAQVLVAMAAPPPSSPAVGANAPRVARRLPASAKQTATLASPVNPQGPPSSPAPMPPILIGVGAFEAHRAAPEAHGQVGRAVTTPRPAAGVPSPPPSAPGSSPPVSPPGGELAAPPLVARAPRSGPPSSPPSTPTPGTLGARPLGPRTEMAPTVPMPQITVTGMPASQPGGVQTADGPLVLRAPGSPLDRKPPSSRGAARRARPELEIARVVDEVTIRKDSASFGLSRTRSGEEPDEGAADVPVDGKRYDDLDEDTRVIPGRQQLGRILHAVEPASSRAAPSTPAPAPVADVDDTPSGEADPDVQGATSHDLARSVPGWPEAAAPTTLPALAAIPALRVAVLATAQAGEVRIVPLVPGSVAPSGAVTAVLVPSSAEEGEALARLFLGSAS